MISINPLVHIIILNWNGYNDTLECVISISKINYNNYEIVIIDNGSESNEIDNILLIYPNIKIIKSIENLGFSAGNNLGFNYSLDSGADYVLLLNNDTIVKDDFLDLLINNVNKIQTVGIAVPKINYYSNPNIIWYAGGYISKIRGSGYTIGEGVSDNEYSENKYVSFATGCCLLIKTNVLKEVGLMDTKYFLYLEDVDYCIRTLEKNYRILYVGNSKIYHKISVSTSKKNKLLQYYYVTRNRFYFVKKFYPNFYKISFLIILFIYLLKIGFWFLTGEKRKIKIVNKAIVDFFTDKMGKCFEI